MIEMKTPVAEHDIKFAARSGVPGGGDTAEIEAALDVLLRDILIERERREAERDSTPGPIALRAYDRRRTDRLPSRMESAVDRIIEDPVNGPRLMGVRLLGERLGSILGSLEHLQDVAERVADRDPPNYGRRLAIIDSRWNGIKARDGSTWWS